MGYPFSRGRILRKNDSIRKIVAETVLSMNDFIAPVFVTEGKNLKEPINSMPGYYKYSRDLAVKESKSLFSKGIKSILLFVKVPQSKKDNKGKEALNPGGLMQTTIRDIKNSTPGLCVMSDVALDPYSVYGHDGLVRKKEILNDETVNILSEMSLTHAAAGVDFVAPSDMMDGRIMRIREAFEQNGFKGTGILSYSAKYASSFYGPFREILDSAPSFGDKKTYQMDYSNVNEAIREARSDVDEGADIVMIKPALAYLDVIRIVKDSVNVPVAAYNVSGEYAMIKAAAKKGWLDEDKAILEILTGIKRAGADIIVTYFINDLIRLIRDQV